MKPLITAVIPHGSGLWAINRCILHSYSSDKNDARTHHQSPEATPRHAPSFLAPRPGWNGEGQAMLFRSPDLLTCIQCTGVKYCTVLLGNIKFKDVF